MPKVVSGIFAGRFARIAMLALTVLLVIGGVALASGGGHDGGHGGGGLPQFNPKSFASQLTWLVGSLVFLYLMLSTVALPRINEVLETRDSRIAWDIGRAEELKNEASATLAEIDQALAEARATAQGLINRAADEHHQEAQARLAQLDAELATRTKAAEVRIQAAKDDILAEMRTLGGDLVQSISRQLTGAEIEQAKVTATIGAIVKEKR